MELCFLIGLGRRGFLNSAQSGVELSISPGFSPVQNVVFSSAFGFSRKWTKVLVRIGSGGIL
jgi:hypothetical protein